MATLIDSSDTLKDFISPRKDINTPIYNWHAFKHSYSKKLVDHYIKDFSLKKNSWVLDTFCGGGTTLLACKENSINSVGLDILPFSVFLSKVKTRTYDIPKLLIELESLRNIGHILTTYEVPQIEIIPRAFSIPVQNEIALLMSKIDLVQDTKAKDFFKLAVFGILEFVSKAEKAGGFLRLVDKKVRPALVSELFFQKCEQMIIDVTEANINLPVTTDVQISDSRSFELNREFDAIITSPPYPNRHDYTRIYSLELILGFMQNDAQMKSLRYKTLRSHVEAKATFEVNGYEMPRKLQINLKKIEKEGMNNPQVMRMLKGYFEDMFLVFQQLKKSLKKNGQLALVVSNVRFSGENILVDEILSDIGAQVGLKPQKIEVARYRGNSAQQMKKYLREPSRESVVIWKK